MAIVIDANCLSSVFNDKNAEHAKFKPVKDFVCSGVGKVIYGGNTYKKELQRAGRHLKFVMELRKAGRAILVRDDVVDTLEGEISEKTQGKKCDDPHIVALLSASNCGLLCSNDQRSFPFIHDKSLYKRGNCDVKIYTSPRNKNILIKQKARLWNVVKS